MPVAPRVPASSESWPSRDRELWSSSWGLHLHFWWCLPHSLHESQHSFIVFIVAKATLEIAGQIPQSDGGECRGACERQRGHIHLLSLLSPAGSVMWSTQFHDSWCSSYQCLKICFSLSPAILLLKLTGCDRSINHTDISPFPNWL